MVLKKLLTVEQHDAIVAAIVSLEKRSSAEVRVHIESACGDPVERAGKLFVTMGMENTRERNGVLVYIAAKSHKCAIIGDEGADMAVPSFFWARCSERMTAFFKKGEFARGILSVIDMLSDELAKHFPYRDDDKNELPDDISYGE